MYYVIYPDTFWATEKQIRNWYADAITNEECDLPCLDPDKDPIFDVARELESTGKFTFDFTLTPYNISSPY